MAWKTGQHAEAPQGVLCYGAEGGRVTWYEEETAPPPERAAPAHPPEETARHGSGRH